MQDEILAVRDGFRGSWMGIGWKGVVWEFMYVGVWGDAGWDEVVK